MKFPKILSIGCMFVFVMLNAPDAVSSQPELDKKVITAVKSSNVSELATWFANGGDINRQTRTGNTLLMMAAKIGDRPTIEFLISQKPDLNRQNSAGATALMIAAKYGHVYVIDLFLDYGADPTVRNNFGSTAARFALAYDHEEIYYKLRDAELVTFGKTRRVNS